MSMNISQGSHSDYGTRLFQQSVSGIMLEILFEFLHMDEVNMLSYFRWRLSLSDGI